MIGVFANAIAIVIGGLIGLFLNNTLSKNYEKTIFNGIGITVFFLGASGAVNGLNNPDISSLMFVVFIVLGGIIGEFLKIEERLESFGHILEKRVPSTEKSFSKGFVTASLVFCVGSMAILGSLQSGTTNDNSILYAKSVIDGITSIIFAATFGFGVIFSAISIIIYEGILTLSASVVEPILTDVMKLQIFTIGGVLISMIGFNMLEIKKFKVGNFLPSVVLPVIYYLIIKK